MQNSPQDDDMGAGKQGQTPQEETTKDLNDEAFRRVTHINIEHPNDLRLLSTPRTVPLTWRGPLLLRRRIILATNVSDDRLEKQP